MMSQRLATNKAKPAAAATSSTIKRSKVEASSNAKENISNINTLASKFVNPPSLDLALVQYDLAKQ
jgi:hypothetical protein